MAEKIKKKEKWIFIVSLMILLAFFTQLFNFPNKLAIICTFLICIIYCIVQKKVLFGTREVLLLITMLLYIWFSGRRNFTGISIVVLLVLFQMTARYLENSSGNSEIMIQRLWLLLGVFVLGYTIHAALNAKMFLKLGSDFQVRRWMDFWTGSDVPATQHNFYYLPVMALVFPALLYIKRRKLVCSLILIAAVFSLWFSLITQSRSLLFIFMLVFIWEIFLLVVYNWKDKKRRRKIFCCGGIVLAVLIVAGWLVWLNRDAIQLTSFYTIFSRDGGILHNVRFQAQYNVVKQLFVYPFGGYHMDLAGLNYAHNVWLDMANAAGVIPFVLMLVYTLLGMYDLFFLLRSEKVCQAVKYVISGLWIVMILYYMVEPALESSVQFIVPWTFMNGLIYQYNRREKAEVAVNGEK